MTLLSADHDVAANDCLLPTDDDVAADDSLIVELYKDTSSNRSVTSKARDASRSDDVVADEDVYVLTWNHSVTLE